ncbi:hypothetical protein [Bacillus pacificus]|uniref:hypothetical protein n=1 Tax=Bacillus pacificus TaxID=2026187 RepID=UPI00398FFD64
MDKYIYAYLLTNAIMMLGKALLTKSKEADKAREIMRQHKVVTIITTILLIPIYLPVRIFKIAKKLLKK